MATFTAAQAHLATTTASGNAPFTPSSGGDASSVSPRFTLGQGRPGYVPIGQPGVASVLQGNSPHMDSHTRGLIIRAERDAGLTFADIHAKYNAWGKALSTLRTIDRNLRLQPADRPRVPTWTTATVSSICSGEGFQGILSSASSLGRLQRPRLDACTCADAATCRWRLFAKPQLGMLMTGEGCVGQRSSRTSRSPRGRFMGWQQQSRNWKR